MDVQRRCRYWRGKEFRRIAGIDWHVVRRSKKQSAERTQEKDTGKGHRKRTQEKDTGKGHRKRTQEKDTGKGHRKRKTRFRLLFLTSHSVAAADRYP
jgi:hypothetical protein